MRQLRIVPDRALVLGQVDGQLAAPDPAGEEQVQLLADRDRLLGRVGVEVESRERALGGLGGEHDVAELRRPRRGG